MNLTTVREIYRSRETYLDKEVQIGGWVRSVRGSKNFGFIVVSDGSYFETLQVVYHDTHGELCGDLQVKRRRSHYRKGYPGCYPGGKAAVRDSGDRGCRRGTVPLRIIRCRRNATALEYLRTISHLRPRTNTFQAVFRVRSLIAYAIHQYLPGERLRICPHSTDHRK